MLQAYSARLRVTTEAPLPGSFWGAPEAGLVRDELWVLPGTPLHSLLHELGHVICMTPQRRAALHTDAGGDDCEECAVCYLQVLLGEHGLGLGREHSFRDMDAWGYSFRQGGAGAWFYGDGREARRWLLRYDLIDRSGRPTGRLRGHS